MATLEQTYDERIDPLMKQIIAICKEAQLPMVATFQIYDPEIGEESLYCTTSLLFDRGDDRMQRCDQAVRPSKTVALAETVETKPDGSRHITIRRVT